MTLLQGAIFVVCLLAFRDGIIGVFAPFMKKRGIIVQAPSPARNGGDGRLTSPQPSGSSRRPHRPVILQGDDPMFKDILIHLDGGDRDPLRIATARGIAERFAGRPTGLFAGAGPHRGEAAARSAQQASEAPVGTAATTRWSRLESLLQGATPSDPAITGRLADVLVLGRHHTGRGAPGDLFERVVLQSGRPTLVLPSVGAYPTVGSSVLIAWNGRRGAARALHMAMPLITRRNRSKWRRSAPPAAPAPMARRRGSSNTSPRPVSRPPESRCPAPTSA